LGIEDWGVVLLAVNPFGGILAAIPLGILGLGHPWWAWLVAGPFLAYVQVPVVDLAWDLLLRWPWWRRLLERRRSPRIERLMSSGFAFWPVFLASPLVGPWFVMAFLRYARQPQRRAALPMLLSMLAVSVVTVAACVWLPALFR
jgi:hypothetical protein